MISRYWRGLAKPSNADAYVEHLRSETFPMLSTIPGFINASVLKRHLTQGIEFLVVTNWESIAAIEQFAGHDSEIAVVPEQVQQWMIDYDRRVRHYETIV